MPVGSTTGPSEPSTRLSPHFRSSVHNPLLPLFRSKRKMLRVHRLDLHRNTDHATPRRTKHIPPSLIFHIIQKIFLLIHFELQFRFPPVAPASRRLSRGRLARAISNTKKGRDRAPQAKSWQPGAGSSLLIFHVHVLGIDHALIFLGLTASTARARSSRFSARACARSAL